ncbi:MAG TPA: YdcF family protein [Candidatus Limnocylindrales bacterium]|nr:YdcF family protein [Candidatus Limnocylindrales bacterium]
MNVRLRVEMVVSLAARGAALFLATFIVIGLVGELRGRATDLNLWWIDIRDLPGLLRLPLLAAFAAILLMWAVRTAPGTRLRRATAAAAALFALLAIRDTARYAAVLGGGFVHPSLPFPLSLVIAVGLGILAIVALRPRPGVPSRRRSAIGVLAAAAGWAVVFPLAQMLFFGTTDYRRPADAAVVFGARVYATGRPSPLLADRIATGVELYRTGLVGTLVMSGGDGADGFNEARVMRDEAVAAGVDQAAILVDAAGNTTEATVDNTLALLAARGGGAVPTRLIAVSQAYHLPRIQLAYANGGIDVLTVPAPDPEPIREMPLLALREVPAFWAYFIRVCLG